MKKSKKFLFTMCAGALATTMVMGNSGVVALAESAKAEAKNVDGAYSQVKGVNESTVEFGEKITIPSTVGYLVNVINPKGEVLSANNNGLTVEGENLTLVANMVGHYTVIIYKGDENGTKYTYDVLCTSAKEYKLEIDDAKIPSFLKVGDTANFSLPDAKVYYEEDGEKVYVEGANVVKEITGVADITNVTEDSTAFVTYKYQPDNATGVYVDAQYKILIQSAFADSVAPSLSVGSYSETCNLNMKYTLPKATATDAYDERVEVRITVTDSENNDVLKAIVDEKTGYAIGTESAKVEFDNLDNMSFYPTKTGDYTITYVAVDDNDNESEPVSYVLTVKDQKGPTISVDRSSIPQKWAYSKVSYDNEDGDEVAKKTDDELMIYLPKPEYYDNNNEATLKVSLTIKDPEEKQIAKVSDIENLDKDVPSDVTIDNKDMGEFVSTTDKEGMVAKFDIKGYVEAVIAKVKDGSIKSDYKYAGNYSVQYTVQDTKTQSTTSTQTYSINVSENYHDNSTIGISANNVVKNVVLSQGDTFKLPSFTITSPNDTYPNKSYKIMVGATAMDFDDFVGGEEIKLEKDGTGYYLAYEEEKLYVNSGDKLVYEVMAVADSGQSKKLDTQSTEIIIPAISPKEYTVEANADLSQITIDVDKEQNKYVGVEMGVKSSDGDYVSFTATVYYNGTQKVIKDIEFVTPNEDGTYYLEVKVFDIYGTSQVSVYKFDLEGKQDEGSIPSEPASFADTTTVGKAISWYTESFNVSKEILKDDVKAVATAHTISGGRFSWMGNEFTPLQENTYDITDTVLPLDASGNVIAGYESDIKDRYLTTNKVVVSASTAKTIVLDKSMPSYLARDAEASNIPQAVIYDASKNYDYAITIDTPNTVDKKFDSYAQMVEKGFKFDTDGTYTVKYLVGGAVIKSYDIKVGDVTSVGFTVKNFDNDEDYVISKESGYKFNFEEVVLSTADQATVSSLTFKKSIRKADGTLIKEVDGKGDSGRKNKGTTVTLTDSGTYTVTYTVIDQSGNESHKKVTIKITSKTKADNIDYTTLSTIIIVVVCLGIVGIIGYYVLSSRNKNKKKNRK